VKLTKLGNPPGNEGILVRGRLDFPAGTPSVFDPAARGAQLRVESVANGAPLLDLTDRTAPIPAGGPGTGCNLTEGWKKTTYRNSSNAVAPPSCPVGSAQGLETLTLKDRRAKDGGIAFKAVVRNAVLIRPAGPLRVTLVLGADPAAGAAGECGIVTFDSDACTRKQRTLTCK
jgi:hypothetical protein